MSWQPGEQGTPPVYETPRRVTATATVVLARNPSAMTLDGTNTWILRAPGHRAGVVVDPGPALPTHLRRVAELGEVELVLLTHGHGDHRDGAREFAETVGAPLRAVRPEWCVGGAALVDGAVIEAGGLRIEVMLTPGHTADSACFALPDAVLTGDTILGRGSTVVAHPDGTLGDYLTSLRRLAALPSGLRVLPGHGPDLPDLRSAASEGLIHRGRRLDQVRSALARLTRDGDPITADDVVKIVYVDVDQALWPAARQSVLAQLTYLDELDARGDQAPAG